MQKQQTAWNLRSLRKAPDADFLTLFQMLFPQVPTLQTKNSWPKYDSYSHQYLYEFWYVSVDLLKFWKI